MPLQSMLPRKKVSDSTLQLFFRGQTKQTEKHFRSLPAEWYPQSAIQLTWPHAQTDWGYLLEEVTKCYVRIAYEIALRQPLLIVTPEPEKVSSLLREQLPQKINTNIFYFKCPTDDTWARDHGFLTVLSDRGSEFLDFQFNGWGHKFEASKDNAISAQLYKSGMLKGQYIDHLDFVLEGGAIESDGKGTLMTTSSCMLSPERNSIYNRTDLEEMLKSFFSADRVLWVDYGFLIGDDTDGHIDTLARFCPGGKIAYVKCTDPQDEHYKGLCQMEEQLQHFCQLDGTPYQLFPLPLPDPIYIRLSDGTSVSDNDMGDAVERLPATYANFLIMNDAVLYPTYDQPENDQKVRLILQQLFPKYDIVGIDCRVLIKQHGSLHCITMQYPAGAFQPIYQ